MGIRICLKRDENATQQRLYHYTNIAVNYCCYLLPPYCIYLHFCRLRDGRIQLRCVYVAVLGHCNCNEQPTQATAEPRRWKSMLIPQGQFAAQYTQHLLDSQSFEFLICILLAFWMPLIRCTNVFHQGRLSRHNNYPHTCQRLMMESP